MNGLTRKVSLTSLAPELLYNIFDQVDTPIARGISRSLLPFTRATLYREVKLYSIESFRLFCRTIFKTPSIGRYVHVFNVYIGNQYFIEGSGIDFNHVIVMLRSLSQAHTISIDWCYLSVIIASEVVAMSCLKSMKKLSLNNPFLDKMDCWNFRHFQHFHFYTSLQSIVLSAFQAYSIFQLDHNSNLITKMGECNYLLEEQLRNLTSTKTFEGKNDVISPLFDGTGNRDSGSISNSIRNVELFGQLGNQSLIETITKFKSITSLVVEEYKLEAGNTGRLFHHLESAGVASQIHTLCITTTLSTHSSKNDYLLPRLPIFTSLTTLIITPNSFSRQLFQYLRDPLSTIQVLEFTEDCEVHTEDLFKLLSFKVAAHSSLTTLKLNNIVGKIDSRRIEVVGLPLENGYYHICPYSGWQLPLWKKGIFEEEELVGLIELGKELKVSIIGTSVDSIGIVELYNQECYDAFLAGELLLQEKDELEDKDSFMEEFVKVGREEKEEKEYQEIMKDLIIYEGNCIVDD